VEVNKLVDDAGADARKELRTPVEIEEVDEFPALDDLYVEKRAWKKIKDVVVVSANLKGSTKLNFDRYAQTSAQLYEAVTGNMVKLVSPFDPASSTSKATACSLSSTVSAATSARSARRSRSRRSPSTSWCRQSRRRWPIASRRPGQGRGGRRNPGRQEGRRARHERAGLGRQAGQLGDQVRRRRRPQPAHCRAQGVPEVRAERLRHALLRLRHEPRDGRTRAGLWRSEELWSDTRVEALPEEGIDCKLLKSCWCENHGDEFCTAILEGKTHRDDVRRPVAA
jgi:hypothetical protein